MNFLYKASITLVILPLYYLHIVKSKIIIVKNTRLTTTSPISVINFYTPCMLAKIVSDRNFAIIGFLKNLKNETFFINFKTSLTLAGMYRFLLTPMFIKLHSTYIIRYKLQVELIPIDMKSIKQNGKINDASIALSAIETAF